METNVLLNIGTESAVSNLQQLADNVDAAKEALKETTKGTKEYQAALAAVKGAQSAYNETLNFTAKGLTAAEGSFNAMNARLGQLKQAWKETADEMERARLTEEINAQKKGIEALNESIGNYQHRVGDYFNTSGRAIKDFGDGMKIAKGGAEGLSVGMQALAKNPLMATLGLLVSLFGNLIGKMKASEAGQAALNKMMEIGGKIMQPISRVIEWIAVQLGKVGDWVSDHSPQIMGFLKNIVSGVVGVGNTIGNYLLTPIRAVIAAAKGVGKIFKDIFTGNWSDIKKDAQEAANGIGDAFKKGFSVKANFETGKELAGKWLDGMGSDETKKKAEDVGTEIGKAIGEKVEAEVESSLKNAEEALKRSEARIKGRRERDEKERVEVRKSTADEMAGLEAEIDAVQEEYAKKELARIQEEEDREKGRQAVMEAGIAATSSILKSVAAAMEASTDGSEKEAQKIKNLKIAAATIDTLEGALKAYNSMAGIPYVGPILGAIAAATVTAAGVAQIAQIRATKVSAEGGASGTVTAPASGAVNAPTTMVQIPQYAQLTGASEEERLNQPQRVYILASDIEASGRRVQVQQSETSW